MQKTAVPGSRDAHRTRGLELSVDSAKIGPANCAGHRLGILLIHEQQSMLRKVHYALESDGARCTLRSGPLGRATVDFLLGQPQSERALETDLVMFDFTEPTTRSVRLLKIIEAAKRCRSIPMVLLTDENPAMSMSGRLGKAATFSPVGLHSFIAAMNSAKTDRFLGSVTQLQEYGRVLISVPATRRDKKRPAAGNRDARNMEHMNT